MQNEAQDVLISNGTLTQPITKSQIHYLVAAMRPGQWIKNLFVLAPLLFGRKLVDPPAVVESLIAFLVFCLLASGVYIFNDWIDAEEDRLHPEKRFRPIASGVLSVPVALSVSGVLTALGFWLSTLLSVKLTLLAVLYLVITLAYCLLLKRLILLDAIAIASGFVLRVVAGAVAIHVPITHWLIACTFLLALFLAFSKRRQELLELSNGAAKHRRVLEQYSVSYLESVNTIIIGATIVCYALYTVAPETVSRFGTDSLIYGTVFVIYGMLRYLSLVNDSAKGGNPSKVLLTDFPLMLTIVSWSIFNMAVIYRARFEEFWPALF